MKKVTIEFNADGSIKIEGHEFHGTECERATLFLNVALGKIKSEVMKPEFLQKQNQQQKAKQ